MPEVVAAVEQSGAVKDLQVVGDGRAAEVQSLGELARSAGLGEFGQEPRPAVADQFFAERGWGVGGRETWVADQRRAGIGGPPLDDGSL